MLSAIVNAVKSAQNCQNLPKSVQRWNFEIPPKIKILVFFKNLKEMCRRGTRACFHHLEFQSNNFSYAIFIVKNGLCMWISAYPVAENDFFHINVPHLLWVWDFEDMYLTHLETRIWRGTFHIYFKKWFFGLQNSAVPFGRKEKKLFCQLWTCYDLANGEEWVCKIW